MEQDEAATIVDGQRVRSKSASVVNIELGHMGRVAVRVWDGPARLSDLMPVARQVAEIVVEATRKSRANTPQAITCHKHCSACCKYLVPLSSPEAFCLIEEIESMTPQKRDQAKAAFDRAACRVVDQGPPPLPAAADDGDSSSSSAQAIAAWYGKLDITCPFLEGDVCSMYDQRPLACREHMVNTSAELCADSNAATGSAVSLPVSVLEVLRDLAADLEGREPEAILMPIALQWARMHPRRGERIWPARELFRRFADHVHRALRASAGADSAVA